jgi:acyl-CoA synthetase (NDP forming)
LGIATVRSLDELVEAAVLFSAFPRPPANRRVAAIAVSGGEAALVADLGEASSIEFPVFESDVQARLAPHFPRFSVIRNPLDVWGLGWDAARFEAIISVIASVEEFSCVLCFVDAPPLRGTDVELVGEMAACCVRAARRTGKIIVFVGNMSGAINESIEATLSQGGIPYLSGMQTGLCVLGQWLARPIPAKSREFLEPSRPEWVNASDAERFAALREGGIPMVASQPVTSADEAVSMAKRLGAPVVLKGAAPSVLHKTEFGLVRLDLRNDDAIRCAFHDLTERFSDGSFGADAHIELQPMVGVGIELLLAVRNDNPLGSVLVVGLGGTLTELLGDVSLRMAPVDHETARAMLDETRAGRLLRGYRTQSKFEFEPVVSAIVAFSRLASRLSDVATIEINPLIVLAAGRGVCGVDLLLEPKTASAVTNSNHDTRK